MNTVTQSPPSENRTKLDEELATFKRSIRSYTAMFIVGVLFFAISVGWAFSLISLALGICIGLIIISFPLAIIGFIGILMKSDEAQTLKFKLERLGKT